MIRQLFMIVCYLLFIYILYSLFGSLFTIGDGFSIGIQSKDKKCPRGTEWDKKFKYCKKMNVSQGNLDRYSRTLVSANELGKKKAKDDVKKMKTQILNRRDLYANLCPSVYNKKQLKLLNTTLRENQLPGYTQYGISESIRKFPYPSEPIPMNFEFKI